MSDYKFSIIVPVYNVEKYLDKCIHSLVEQKNAEVLLIDDGSKDSSPEICDRYADQYVNVKVVHQVNAGPSVARNKGLDMAVGEYIIFVDSDDYIESYMCTRLEKLLEMYGRQDVIAFEAWEETGEDRALHRRIPVEKDQEYTGRSYLLQHYQQRNMNVEACFHVFNKLFLDKNGFRFRPGVIHEDVEFMRRVVLKAESVLEIPDVFYHYVIRENSISTQKDKTRNIQDLFAVLKSQDELADKQDPEMRKWMKDAILDSYLSMVQEAGMYKKEYRGYLDKRFLLGKAATGRNRFRVMLCCISVRLYCGINQIFKIIRNKKYQRL